MPLELNDDDRSALCSLRHKQDHLQTAVLSLVRGYDTGLFVSGEGGTGKSYICEETLKGLKAPYILHNSRMTGRGLVDQLEKAPHIIHWIEDAETLLDDKRSLGVLRSACWSQSKAKPMTREISWAAHRTTIRFIFTGGVLVVSNVSLVDSSPEIRAIKSRVRVLKMDVTPAEVMALMKTICQQGYVFGPDIMTASECWTVAEFIRERLALLNRSLDLRLVLHGFRDYLLHREHGTQLSWQELVEGRMAECPTRYKTRREISAEEQQLAMEIHRQQLSQSDKVKIWQERTGKNKASYYNALNRKL